MEEIKIPYPEQPVFNIRKDIVEQYLDYIDSKIGNWSSYDSIIGQNKEEEQFKKSLGVTREEEYYCFLLFINTNWTAIYSSHRIAKKINKTPLKKFYKNEIEKSILGFNVDIHAIFKLFLIRKKYEKQFPKRTKKNQLKSFDLAEAFVMMYPNHSTLIGIDDEAFCSASLFVLVCQGTDGRIHCYKTYPLYQLEYKDNFYFYGKSIDYLVEFKKKVEKMAI